tara:strand:- start:172 stop:594 length:423 start_codon:yes stop_codon:yes gene_type:complete
VLAQFQELCAFGNRCFAELSIDPTGVFNQLNEVGSSVFGRMERLSGPSVLFIREISREGGPGPAQAEPPSLESSCFVGEASEVFARFHVANEVLAKIGQYGRISSISGYFRPFFHGLLRKGLQLPPRSGSFRAREMLKSP